jgi:hypothetical protein
MTTHLGTVKCAARVPAQAAVREQVRRVQDALENDTFSWNDRRRTTDYPRATPARAANVRLSMQLMMLRFGTGLSREPTVSTGRSLSQYASSAYQPNKEQHDRDDQ